MKIDRNAWHTRVYLWWYGRKYGYPCEKNRSNLCPYMRAVMFWAPLRVLFSHWVKVGPVPLNAVTIPTVLYGVPTLIGYVSYKVKIGIWQGYGIAILLALGMTALFGIIYLLDSEGKDITRPLRKKVANSSFTSLLREYFRSAHDRVCPEIEFSARSTWKTNSSQ